MFHLLVRGSFGSNRTKTGFSNDFILTVFTVELLDFSDSVELRIEVTTDGLSRSRASVDDILACLSAAESGLDSLD